MDTFLVPGMHLISPRRGYIHHGIYIGNGHVIHYSGFNHGFRRGPVSEISIECFSKGYGISICRHNFGFSAEEIVRRAKSRLDENSYRLLSNNCEHFCVWCVTGQHRSEQVENFLNFPEKILSNFYIFATKLIGTFFNINFPGENYVKQEKFLTN